MIITRLHGGLGNQLFQYALGRSLSIKHNVPLKYDANLCTDNLERPLKLNLFNIKAERATNEEIEKYLNRNKISNRLKDKIYKILNTNYFDREIVEEQFFHFDPNIINKVHSNAYLMGYWQSEKYFNLIRGKLLEELTLIEPPTELNSKMLQKISSSNSVAVHIRRGDYVSNPLTQAYHGTCPISYYMQAVKIIADTINNPHFFIFSDDPGWSKKNIKIKYKHSYIDFNLDKDYEDLRLMSACKNNIIANSSFSWWAAWLNKNNSKKIIAPVNWFKTDENNTQDLIPDNWIRI